MVFSMASIPMTVGSRLMFSNTCSNVSQQMSLYLFALKVLVGRYVVKRPY